MAPTSTRTRTKWSKLEERKQQKSMASCGHATATATSSGTQELGNKSNEDGNEEDICSSGCSTPKAKRFKIPEILTCPPAPKKRKVMPKCSSNRTPIAFFASPDIELFFFTALENVSV